MYIHIRVVLKIENVSFLLGNGFLYILVDSNSVQNLRML